MRESAVENDGLRVNASLEAREVAVTLSLLAWLT